MINDWYLYIFLAALFIKLVVMMLHPLRDKELQKRKKIVQEVDQLKERYTNGKNDVLTLFNFQSIVPKEDIPAFKEESNAIVKKHKGRPILIILPLFIQAVLFLVGLAYLRTNDAIAYHILLPIIATILSFFLVVTKKTLLFSVLMTCLVGYLYTKMNGSVVLFIIFFSLFSIIEKQVEKAKKKKNENKNVQM